MCGHGPKISRSRLSIFYFHRTNSPNPWRPDLKENEAVGAAIWQNHLSHFLVLSQFLFSIAFFQTKMVHRVFFLHSGFAGMWKILECFAFLYFSHVLHKFPFYRGITSNISGICGTEGASRKWKIM